MNDSECPPAKRMRFSCEELQKNNKDEIIALYLKQQQTIEQLQERVNLNEHKDYKTQLAETSRRENVLVMRLTTKEQELQDYAAQISQIKKSQEDAASRSLREAMLDPAVNLMFNKMKDELKETKDKLEQAQSELSAWKFTPDSQSGKKLMSRCRTLIAENQELGRQLSQGKVAQLEAELALQKKYSEELKESQEELNDIVIQLDEEVEGMQSTIQLLQQQLIDSKKELEKYKKIVSDMTNSKSRYSQDEFRTKDLHSDVKIEHKCSDAEMDVADEYLDIKNEVGEKGFVTPDREDLDEKSSLGSGDSDYDDYDRTGERDRKSEISDDDRNGGRSSLSSDREIIDETCDSTPERTMERNSSAKVDEGVSSPRDNNARNEYSNKSNRTSQTRKVNNDSGDEEESVVRIFSTSHKPSDDNVAEVRSNYKVNLKNSAGENLAEINGRLADENDILPSKTETNNLDKDPVIKILDKDPKSKDKEQEYKEKINKAASIKIAQHCIPEGVNKDATEQAKYSAHQNSVEEAENADTSKEKEEPVAGNVKEQDRKEPTSAVVSSSSNDSTSFLLNPQFQQQHALMAEQAAIIYKTILAQQQLAMVDDKSSRLPGGTAGEDVRNISPLLQGLQYAADPSAAAYLAQYKAMLAAQQMLMPTADGKTPQLLSASGLGLYPGVPLVQQNLVAQHSSDSATNGVPTSWAAGTNVGYAHPLLPHHPSLFAPNPAGPMFPPGPNLTPHSLTANAEGERHHGSGDHGPLQNGLPVQKQSETKTKEDTQAMA